MLNVKKLLTKILDKLYDISRTKTQTVYITRSTGNLVTSQALRYGNVIWLRITVNNSSAVASQGNVFTGTLVDTALRPHGFTTGGSYYQSHSIMGGLGADGAITIRNASSSSVTISGSNNVTMVWTYII